MFWIEPPEDRWDRLSLFMTRDLLEIRYRERHGLQISAGKANEIIAHLDQARQYFKSSESAGILAGPLEQYYGVLALSRAIVLYRVAAAREATLKKAHGLESSLPDASDVEKIVLTLGSGTFSDLLAATGNIELVTVDEPTFGGVSGPGQGVQRDHLIQLGVPPAETSFLLIDVLSRIPGLREHFELSMDRPANCYSGRLTKFMSTLSLTVWPGRYPLPPAETLREALCLSPDANALDEPGSQKGVRFDTQVPLNSRVADLLPYVIQAPTGSQTAVAAIAGGLRLGELACYFAASHALSMLVRYYPTVWAAMATHAKGDRLFPLLQRTRGLIQTEFVRLALWELERPA